MRTLKVVIATVLAGAAALVAAGLVIIYSGVYNVAADIPHHPLEYWLLFTARDQSVTRRSRDIRLPEGITSDARIERGAARYEEMCVICHLRPGLDNTPLRRGLLPEPPKLERWAEDPAKTFWIVKHGIRMTGMPAWGRTHDDETLWDVVAFLQRLPGLTEEEYVAMVRAGGGEVRDLEH